MNGSDKAARRTCVAVSLYLLLSIAPGYAAGPFAWAEIQNFTVCPADGAASGLPQFVADSCDTKSLFEVDPQKRTIWVRAVIRVSRQMLDSGKPLGFFVSAKAASRVYLRGRLIGSNGVPAAAAADERPGQMDAVVPIPVSQLREGNNEFVMFMSGHHSLLDLTMPVHVVGIGEYSSPVDGFLRHYWPSLITFGAFIAGAMYFGIALIRRTDRLGSLLLCLVSAFAAGQLLSEVSRGMFAYSYPFHDVRLLLILLFSAGFGLCLAAHVINRFIDRRRAEIFAGTALLLFLIAWLGPSGFDGKAAVAVLVPTLTSIVCVVAACRWKKPDAVPYLIALSLFAIVILTTAQQFLDVVFFYTVACLLLFLFGRQATALTREQALREEEADRRRSLQRALEQAVEKQTPRRIQLREGSNIARVSSDQIVHCAAAGDYVEIDFVDGRQFLHSGSLNDLEEQLPATFLRVHRSHVVNSVYIQSLQRKRSGTGVLFMDTGVTVPVSRRILPSVRQSITVPTTESGAAEAY